MPDKGSACGNLTRTEAGPGSGLSEPVPNTRLQGAGDSEALWRTCL